MSRFISGRDLRFVNTDSVPLSGATVTTAIGSTATPSAANHLVTKSYVDTAVANLPFAGNSLQEVYQGGVYGTGCAGTWTVPSNVTNIFVQVWGGGGGGGMNCNWKAASPGGGGGYSHRSIPVTGGQVFCYCAGGGGRGGVNYPGAKVGCAGCNSRFCGPTSGGTVCVISCGGSGGSCNGNIYGTRVCGGLSSGGDINIPGGDGYQFSCCACAVIKCQGAPNCYSATIIAGGSFLGAPNSNRLTMCCCRHPDNGCPFGGGGHGGLAGGYSNSCSPGRTGGGGAVIIWY